MIENKISQKERLEKLNITARRQIEKLVNDKNIIGITKYDKSRLLNITNK